MTPTAFQATFASFRLVQGRKVAQLIFEVPIEAADNALSVLGGVPNPEQTRWVGIARITEPKKKPSLSGKDIWRASSECALLCKEPKFWKFLNEFYWDAPILNEERAVFAIRKIIEIESRSDIDRDGEAASRWGDLQSKYEQWEQLR